MLAIVPRSLPAQARVLPAEVPACRPGVIIQHRSC